jgi:adhesin/invasin
MEAIELVFVSGVSDMTADGISQTDVQVRVRTVTFAKPLTFEQVDFAAEEGLITAAVLTDQFGIATAQFKAALTTSAADTITASLVPGLDANLVQPYVQPVLSIFASDVSLPADGEAETDLKARLLSPTGTPVVGAKIQFGVTSGPVDVVLAQFGTGQTDSNGEAFASIKAGQTAGTVAIQATFSTLTANTSVTLQDINLTVSSQPAAIVANGTNKSTISVLVTEAITNAAIPGVSVQLSTTLGSIPPAAVTNASGVASAQLTAGTATGTATVTATLGTRNANTTVDLLANTLSVSVTSSSVTGSILRDGIDVTNISVLVQDPDGKLLSNLSAAWSVTATGGATPSVFPQSGQTGADGTHSTQLMSDSGTLDAIATVQVDVGGVIQTIDIDLRGITITPLGANPDTILANRVDNSLIQWQATETTTGSLIKNHSILITKVSGPGVILSDASETTTAGGTAGITARSTSAAGNLVMRAKMGLVEVDQTLVILADQLAVAASADDMVLLRDGTEESNLTISVTDRFGDPVEDQRVDLILVGDGTLDKSFAFTDAVGQIHATLATDIGSSNSSAQITANAAGVTDVLTISLSGVQLSVAVSPSSIVADGTEQATVTARLKEIGNNSALPGRDIIFAITPGTFADINATEVTDNQGLAVVTVTADTAAALTATITAQLGEDPGTAITATTNLDIQAKPTTAATISLEATPTDLQVQGTGGVEAATITATLLGSNNQPVATGRDVEFTMSPTGAGTFANGTEIETVQTNADGEAVIQFQSGNLATDVTISARDVGGTVSSTTSLMTVSAGPTAEIDISAVVMEFGSSGLYERELHALLTDVYGNVRSTANVVWTATPDTTGGIQGTSVTDDSGVATSYYTYARGFEVDAHTIYATNQGVTDSLVIPQGSISITSAASSVLRDGLSGTSVTATITDAYGTPVTLLGLGFSVTAGSGAVASAVVAVDDNGQATNTYTSDANSADASGEVTATFRFLNDAVTINTRGVTISAVAIPDTLSANGMATTTVTASLKETTANVALASKTVTFSTNLGTVGGSAVTDAVGSAATTFTAGTATGTATVTASYGGLNTTAPVELITSSSASIVLGTSETDLQVLGTGGTETATITATVRDAVGSLVAAGTAVTFTSNTGTFDTGFSTYATQTDANGQATATFQSGTVTGTVTITATSGTASGSAALITIAAGPPTQILVDYPTGATTPANGFSSIQIGALVSDAQGNAVAEGTQVFFEITTGAGLATIQAYGSTNDTGLALVTLTYPGSNIGVGPVIIDASSGSATGQVTITLLP